MSAFGFAHPEWLAPLALGLGATLLLVVAARLRARRRLRRLLGSDTRTGPGPLTSDVALGVALAALALALLGPRLGEREVRMPASGVDVVLLLDVSHSMQAADVPPTRLDRARRAAEGLLARLAPGDRAALAAFAGAGALLTPLTPDRDVLVELLAGLHTDLVRPASSNLPAGLRTALEAFEAGSERPRVLVVLSDGEDPEGRAAASGALRRAGVRVVAAAFGSDAGATLSDHGAPLVDRWGRTVVSRRDASRLAALASETDGSLWLADAWGELDLDAAVASIRRDAGAAPGETSVRRVPAVRVLPFAALAFAILLLEGQARPRGWRAGCPSRLRGGRPPQRSRPARSRRPGNAAAAAGALLLGVALRAGGDGPALAALEARVRERPEEAAALLALGAARLERGEREAASRAFLAAAVHARDPHAAAVAYHDLGVVSLEQGDLEAARKAFLDALALAPDDERARFNLEWTLVALARQEPPAPSEEPESPGSAPPPAAPEPAPEPPAPRELPPPLDARAQRELLERVEDDPEPALRSAVAPARQRSASGAAVW